MSINEIKLSIMSSWRVIRAVPAAFYVAKTLT